MAMLHKGLPHEGLVVYELPDIYLNPHAKNSEVEVQFRS